MATQSDTDGPGTDLLMCRSCMGQGEQMKSLFELPEEKSRMDEELRLSDMISDCTTIRISAGDGLPSHLCLDCETTLIIAYNFKQQTLKSDETLRYNLSIQDDVKPILSEIDNAITNEIGDDENEEDNDNAGFMDDDFAGGGDEFDEDDSEYEEKPKKTKGLHKCEECPKSFSSAQGLRMHKRAHKRKQKEEDEDNEYIEERRESHTCNICSRNLSTAEGLKNHMKRHSGTVLQCKLCDKSFTKSNHMKRHMANVHAEEYKAEKQQKKLSQVLQCEFCDKKFKYRKSYALHMQNEHGLEDDEDDVPLIELVKTEIKHLEPTVEIQEDNDNKVALSDAETADKKPQQPIREYKCHVCAVVFTRSNHLTRHMTLHRAVLNFKCTKCDQAYASQEHLDKHMQEDHVNKPYVCTVCNRTFSRGEHLIRHLKTHVKPEEVKMLKCSVCDLIPEFKSPEDLGKHIKEHLQQDKRHICSECGKAFNRLDNLKTHQRIHSGHKDNVKLHLCIYCGKEFNNSSNMTVHMRRHTGERPYKCNICDKGFPRSHDLKCHERTHSGEKPYLCNICGKSFNKSNKLLRHSRVHTGERPYLCNLCGRAFTQSNDLALHMRRHTGARPYACGECPARFIQSGQLKAHRKSTGHWAETVPDLKGGHRVEPVIPIGDPTPIRFKVYGKNKPELEEKKVDTSEIVVPETATQVQQKQVIQQVQILHEPQHDLLDEQQILQVETKDEKIIDSAAKLIEQFRYGNQDNNGIKEDKLERQLTFQYVIPVNQVTNMNQVAQLVHISQITHSSQQAAQIVDQQSPDNDATYTTEAYYQNFG